MRDKLSLTKDLSTNRLKGRQSGGAGAEQPECTLVHEDCEHHPTSNHGLLGDWWTGYTSFGFVLAELIVVLAILAGLAVTTFPALGYWLARERLDTYAQALLTTFSYARSEVLKRGMPVTVCRSNEHGECSVSARVCSANERGKLADDWGCGYAVIAEASSAAGERFQQALRVQAPLVGVTLHVKNASPLWFTPPVGQIAGDFRSFELAARFGTDSNLSERLHRCVKIAEGGRAQLINGPCTP